jgi:(S)-mandelate dehydrogenase
LESKLGRRVSLSLRRAHSIGDLRKLSRRRLPRCVFDFFDGGAEDEISLAANTAALDRVRLLPRVLAELANVETGAQLLDAPVAMPLGIAPMGACGLGWRDADVAVARAAAAAGVPYTLSSAAYNTIEEVATRAGGRLWFQPYMLRQREVVLQLIERARSAGYEALVVTVDLPVGGKRERDLRNRFTLPFRLTPRTFLDFAARPAWSLPMLMRGRPLMGNMVGMETRTGATAAGTTVGSGMDASFSWTDLQHLRDLWPGKLIVKGVLRPDDARRLVALGCDAIVVSNHGGRQLDGALSTFEALPGVVAAAGGGADVLLDGGVRRGRHILQALAAGASGVLVGRSVLYGLAAAGEPGATRALEILREEFTRTLRLCGCRSVKEVDSRLLAAQ